MDSLFDAIVAGSLANRGGGGGGGGTDNYNALSNLPQINGTTLMGNKSSSALGLQDTIDSSHKLSADLVSETSSKKFNVQADWEQTTDTAADYIKHKPTLGTASAKNIDYFATATQGTKADSAIQGIKLNNSTITPSSAKVVSLTVDKTTVELGNVTNNAQVKKISSSVTDNIVTWGAATGDTVKDSGVAIETSISADSDAKIPTSKAIATALSGKQDTISDLSTIRSGAALGATAVQPETGKGLSTNDFTDAEKTKLAGIEAQANKTTVDDALSGSSTNPVQNKVVKTALDLKADATDIPTVNNATITIQKNGTKVDDFTVNASSNKTINITVPTTASDVNALPSSTKYAGAATAGGSATSAAKLDTASAGSVTQPVYFTNGVPTPTTYSLEKSVPSDAVFTDTTYSNMSQSEATTGTATNGRLISAKVLGDTIDEKIAKLGYSIETVTFSSLPAGTTWKHLTSGGFYTSPTIDVSDKFDVIYSATLYDFGNLASNITVMPYIRPDAAKFGLWVTDSTDPQTLPMTAGTMVKVALFGVLKST